jgi:hypothetical protein
MAPILPRFSPTTPCWQKLIASGVPQTHGTTFTNVIMSAPFSLTLRDRSREIGRLQFAQFRIRS